MVLPIIMILITGIIGGGAYYFVKHTEKKKKESVSSSDISANEFINVKDIKDKYLYTKDNHILCFLKIMPISIDLLSKNEKKSLIKTLTAELTSTQFPFKFIAVSRPVDISPLISELSSLMATRDTKQKELLKHEMLEISTFVLSGEVVERQFFIVLWSKYEEGCEQDLYIRSKNFSSNFESCGIKCEILNQQEIVRLCNLINNPAYTHLENTDFDASIPIYEF